ncbi:hypothetical protein CBP31_13805 [Oceanisphaera profunda]|uniref:DUF559 domain-containing protein n=1 Tax=Oceanisphaera profunda TaxID=1416627 RepID=A0A1Y0D7Q2_9GAMM|nr:DUF559 domain-containing protein [Oceanisphaera profunda]ART83572.1 hypothetical protein CBP31_13805 [Oceanisphaera profunda]
MNIDYWIKINEANFGSPFEKIFAIKVLAKTNVIDLSAVSTQYHFKDLDGKNRYCDFVIQEGSIKIAIEIDGYDKRNTGQGMSHDDFIDWQRRQAALTAYGWHVLRFANRDVDNEPERCKRYIELLLRDQRSKSQHQANLEEAIGQLNYQLKVAQSHTGSGEETNKLQKEINLLKNQLQLAQATQPLDSSDKNDLGLLVVRLEQEKKELIAAHDKVKAEKNQLTASNTQLKDQSRFLDGENNTMRTTVWAFTVIIGIIVAAGAYVFTNGSAVQAPALAFDNAPAHRMQSSASQEAHPVAQSVDSRASRESAAIPTTSCDSAIDWRLAKNYVDQQIAVRGTVAEYRYMPNVKGAPTWINLGAKYPAPDRLAVVIWGDDRNKFGRALSKNLINRQICTIGTIKLRDGTPQMALKWPRELVFQ